MALNDNRGITITEADKKYNEALNKWKNEKPKGKVYYRGEYAKGFAITSPEAKKAHAKHDEDMVAWNARKPMKSDFTSTSAPSTPSAPTPTPTSTPPKTGESTRQTTAPATKKEEGKINNDLKSVNQRGVASFVRSLLPSKDRLSPSQRMAKAGKSKSAILRKRLGK